MDGWKLSCVCTVIKCLPHERLAPEVTENRRLTLFRISQARLVISLFSNNHLCVVTSLSAPGSVSYKEYLGKMMEATISINSLLI